MSLEGYIGAFFASDDGQDALLLTQSVQVDLESMLRAAYHAGRLEATRTAAAISRDARVCANFNTGVTLVNLMQDHRDDPKQFVFEIAAFTRRLIALP